MLRNIYIVLHRNFLVLTKSPFKNLMLISIEPLLYLLAMGTGLGHMIKNVHGLTYMDYYYPGRLCNSAIFICFFEGTYPTLSKLSYQNTYLSMSLGGIKNSEIVVGEILWCSIKGFLSILSTVAISAFFNIGTYEVIYALPVLFILCIIFSSIAMLLSTKVKKYSSFSYYTTMLVLPVSLFSGSFFPVESLPKYMQYFSQLLPSTYAINLSRSIMYEHLRNGTESKALLIMLAYLIVTVVLCYIFFKKRLEEI